MKKEKKLIDFYQFSEFNQNLFEYLQNNEKSIQPIGLIELKK